MLLRGRQQERHFLAREGVDSPLGFVAGAEVPTEAERLPPRTLSLENLCALWFGLSSL
jgi:hypothetical protein